MVEIPEAVTLARQLRVVSGRRICRVTAAHTPHKFAWYCGDPAGYHDLLAGNTIGEAMALGGLVQIDAGEASIVLGEGISLTYHAQGETLPRKHQLLLEFSDASVLSVSIQMYGGVWCFGPGGFANPYYEVARQKPPPLSERFDWPYFEGLAGASEVQPLSAKAFLATEQRIPGLGNGVLQDILHHAGIHPKCKLRTLTVEDRERLFHSLKATLGEMVARGGRDSEKDLFGRAGGYQTRLSRHTWGKTCPACGAMIQKESYLGGSIYYCGGCQVA